MIDRLFRLYRYWRLHGFAAVWQLILRKLSGQHQIEPFIMKKSGEMSVSQILNTRFPALTPLRTFHPSGMHARRVSLVTDSINSGSLYGGVATSLVFSALLANRLKATLRIITRTERSRPENFDHILSACGIALDGEIEFRLAACYDQNYQIDIMPEEIFVTTSWWTTAATLPCVSTSQIIYLLQEDERMFYPFNDERLKCESILRNRDIRFLINSRLLFDYLIQGGLDNIAEKGIWFEPSFPSQVFRPRKIDRKGKRRFFFYARPNNVRNLFYLGIEVIEQAIMRHVLDMDSWDIYLVGRDIPDITLCGDYKPKQYENLTWLEYADLAGTIDLGLILMYSPHPSYPPLDMVASGAVVVTNRFANKTDLSGYSPNLICADLDINALVDALRRGVDIATDANLREKNFQKNVLLNDWYVSFSEVLKQFSRGA